MYLPKVIKYNAKNPEAAERYAQIAKFIGLEGQSNGELVDALIKELRAMNKSLDIPDGIKDYEGGIIDEKEFLEKLPEVAKKRHWRRLYRFQPETTQPGRDGKAVKMLLL